MNKVLDDQKKFMIACGQTVDEYNPNFDAVKMARY